MEDHTKPRMRDTVSNVQWLIKQVGPAYDAMMDGPSRAIPAKLVFDKIRKRHNGIVRNR